MIYYIFDGSMSGFYSAVFYAWTDKDGYVAREDVQIGLLDGEKRIKSDDTIAARVENKIVQYDPYALEEIDAILRSDEIDAPDKAYLYVRSIMRHRAPVRARLAEDGVTEAMHVLQRVKREVDRFRGFLRFSELKNGILYAPFSPDNNVLELILPHFIGRYKNEKFIIHDVRREIAGLYNGKEAVLTKLKKGEIELSDEEEAFTRLWKDYYNAVNIKERKHTKQMKGSMPVRYWDFLPEKRK